MAVRNAHPRGAGLGRFNTQSRHANQRGKERDSAGGSEGPRHQRAPPRRTHRDAHGERRHGRRQTRPGGASSGCEGRRALWAGQQRRRRLRGGETPRGQQGGGRLHASGTDGCDVGLGHGQLRPCKGHIQGYRILRRQGARRHRRCHAGRRTRRKASGALCEDHQEPQQEQEARRVRRCPFGLAIRPACAGQCDGHFPRSEKGHGQEGLGQDRGRRHRHP